MLFGGVAQLGERLLCKQEVIGSIPFASTISRKWERSPPRKDKIQKEPRIVRTWSGPMNCRRLRPVACSLTL
jgi:hypothetical protein